MPKTFRERILLPEEYKHTPRLIRWNDNTSQMTWRLSEVRTGTVETTPEAIRLSVLPTSDNTYCNAQISDYTQERKFKWDGRVKLTLKAHLDPSVDVIRGTAGFGFWNQPFVIKEKFYALPQAAWFFFGSPPNDMRLAMGVPGSGFKTATIDATKRQFRALIPTAPIGVLLMRVPALYRRLWPIAQNAIGVSEHALDQNLLSETHRYSLEWTDYGVEFCVDDKVVHTSSTVLRGPLGFVAWIDNQYAVVTPQGSFRFGLLPIQTTQSLVLQDVSLSRMIYGDEYDIPD